MGSSLPIRSLRIWAKAASRSVGAVVVVVVISGDGECNSVFSSSNSYVAVWVSCATRSRTPELVLELDKKYCLETLLSCLCPDGSEPSASVRMLRICGGGNATCEEVEWFKNKNHIVVKSKRQPEKQHA